MKETTNMIDFNKLNNTILELEDVLRTYNELEQDLVIQQLVAKRAANKRRQLQNEAVANVPISSLMKRILKGDKDDQEENTV